MYASSKNRPGSNSASSSRNSSPAPSTAAGPSSAPGPSIDPYRTLSAQVKKPVLPLISSDQPPNLPTLLQLDPSTYSSRLSGKTLQTADLVDNPSQASTSASASGAISNLVTGKKRNRGHPSEKRKARLEVEEYELKRKELGTQSMRKVKRRLQGGSCATMGKGMRVSYNALLSLNHLHTTYLIQLLSLPPLPPSVSSSIPTSSATATTYPQPSLHFNPEPILSKLSKADFMGMIIRVKSSKNQSLENLEGIIIEETALTFRIVVAADDKVRVVRKDGTLFTINVPAYSTPSKSNQSSTQNFTQTQDTPFDLDGFLRVCPRMEIDLLGSSFVYRSGDRAGRKFRPPQGGGGGSGWAEEWLKSDWADVFGDLSQALGEHGDRDSGKTKKTEKKASRVSNGAIEGLRKRGKSRRKDPPAGGSLQVY
ncbi:hypothetical protein IAT40_001129 [Kwoniella sp. CBS 6097]